jgi:hypothetical protein
MLRNTTPVWKKTTLWTVRWESQAAV